ncbi:YsnF/AvaK domain-containing protein (plasmid) [Curtobacterium sp. TC1]|uniref:YsnF/AvaK domain-containing protein n=1 Tax=Curtobacterium sp. TC1 TaxID=2862880 RepID=UPI001C9AD35E|nr:YsnF/AvaK domain-containing protein [Curtobacterium sp. TC1]QZQ53673.1 YsnF/AvaK domain-containing protein [Curtobacterium sp. TC1]
MIDNATANRLFDVKVVDPHGAKVGTVKQVYLNNENGLPLFVSVATGLFGTSESFVPLQDATYAGDELRVGYDKDRIKDAPRIDADGDLSEDEQERIWDYYGLTATTGAPTNAAADNTQTTHAPNHDITHADDAVTRSEERLNVGTQNVQTGRARLRKHIVTEQQTVTVPVQHEELRVVTEPITETNVGSATDRPALSEDEHEVTLHEERVVVDKETIPVERVHIGKETVTEQQQVTEDVSHEEIEIDEDDTKHR